MLDKYYFDRGDSYNEITITEKRAPTDESIKILKEMEEKTLNKILSSVKLDNNLLTCQIVFFKNYFDHTREIYIIFELNGIEHKVQIRVDADKSLEEIISIMKEELSGYIVEQILKNLFKGLNYETINNC